MTTLSTSRERRTVLSQQLLQLIQIINIEARLRKTSQPNRKPQGLFGFSEPTVGCSNQIRHEIKETPAAFKTKPPLCIVSSGIQTRVILGSTDSAGVKTVDQFTTFFLCHVASHSLAHL